MPARLEYAEPTVAPVWGWAAVAPATWEAATETITVTEGEPTWCSRQRRMIGDKGRMNDMTTSASSRRGFLKTAAAMAGGLGAAQMSEVHGALAALPTSTDGVLDILNAALTMERVVVTYLTTALSSGGVAFPPPVRAQVQTNLDAERQHRDIFVGLGGVPLDKGSFYYPAGSFDSVAGFAATAVNIETLFVGLYLVASIEASQRGYQDLAVICAQIMGLEAEHRAGARKLRGDSISPEIAYERYLYTSVGNPRDGDQGSALNAILGYTVPGTTSTGAIALPAESAVVSAIGGHTAIAPAPPGPNVATA